MDIIYADAEVAPILESVLNHLKKKRKHIVFYLHGILASSSTSSTLASYLSHTKQRFFSFRVITPYINLKKIQMEEYIKKKQKLHRLDRREKRIRENGTVQSVRIKPDKMQEIFHLHDKRWKKKSDTSGFTSPIGKEFYSSLANLNLDRQNFETQMDGLFLDNKLIAFNFGYRCRDRYTSYVLGFDDDYDVFSPGRILEKEKILQCSQQNVPIFDLSIGFETYKFEWHTDLDYTERYLFSTNSFLSNSVQNVLALKEKVIDKIKQYPKIVLFKRNKVGKLLYVLKNIFKKEEKSDAKKILKEYLNHKWKKLFLNKSYTIYEMLKKDVPVNKTGVNFVELTMKNATLNYPKFEEYLKEICTKIYGAFTGYYVENNSSYRDVFWTNEKVIRIDDISYIKDFRKSSILIENWKEENLLDICTFVKEHSKSNKIILYIPTKSKKDQYLVESIGFVKSYQINKRSILGFSRENIIHFQ